MKPEMYSLEAWVTNVNPTFLKTNFENLLLSSGFKIEGFVDKDFISNSPEYSDGWTGEWLLSESHFAIHTFGKCSTNSEEVSYIQLSSCVFEYYRRFMESLFLFAANPENDISVHQFRNWETKFETCKNI